LFAASRLAASAVSLLLFSLPVTECAGVLLSRENPIMNSKFMAALLVSASLGAGLVAVALGAFVWGTSPPPPQSPTSKPPASKALAKVVGETLREPATDVVASLPKETPAQSAFHEGASARGARDSRTTVADRRDATRAFLEILERDPGHPNADFLLDRALAEGRPHEESSR